MKKFLAVFLSLIVVASMLAACSNNSGSHEKNTGKISVVTTIFPIYDWVNNVIGNDENAEVSFLLNNGADLHNYQPTADDMVKMSDCDMFIYVGGESDVWVDDALKNAVNKNMVVINLLDVLGEKVKEEEVKEGMQSEEEEESEEPEYDEHIWLSVKNAIALVSEIGDKLSSIGKEGNPYKQNAASYVDEFSKLEKEYEEVCNNAKTKTLLFGDRFPFRYLVDDYGIDYYAAFAGCSAETEASFETISFLANKVDELNLKYVMTIENSDSKIAETIIQNTKAKSATILAIDSLQNTTSEDVEQGKTYLETMKNNLEVLKTALN